MVITGNNVIRLFGECNRCGRDKPSVTLSMLPSATINIVILRSTTSRATTGGFYGHPEFRSIDQHQLSITRWVMPVAVLFLYQPGDGTTGTITGISNTGAAAGTITLNNNTVQGIQSLSVLFLLRALISVSTIPVGVPPQQPSVSPTTKWFFNRSGCFLWRCHWIDHDRNQ